MEKYFKFLICFKNQLYLLNYVNNMSYVNYMSIFKNHVKSNNFFHNI